MHVHAHTCRQMHANAHTFTYMHIHVHTCTYMHIHTHTCTHTYKQTMAGVPKGSPNVDPKKGHLRSRVFSGARLVLGTVAALGLTVQKHSCRGSVPRRRFWGNRFSQLSSKCRPPAMNVHVTIVLSRLHYFPLPLPTSLPQELHANVFFRASGSGFQTKDSLLKGASGRLRCGPHEAHAVLLGC